MSELASGRDGRSGWEGVQNLVYHRRSMQYLQAGTAALNMAAWPHDAP